jgi:hypothetical protein
MTPQTFHLILHHLSPDAKAASAAQPDHELPKVTVERLRELLVALAATAGHLPAVSEAAPEIRIRAGKDTLEVRVRDGQLRFVSWETKAGGVGLNVDQIIARVCFSAPRSEPAPLRPVRVHAPAPTSEKLPRWLKVSGLIVSIFLINGISVWMLLKPPPDLLSEFELLPTAASHELLAMVAGDYETGAREGDRRLTIQPDGTMQMSKYGQKRAIIEENNKTVRGALTSGKQALLTNDPYLVEIKDTNTVVLYGDTYKRKNL